MADMDFVEVGALDGQSLVPREDDELDWILIGDERGAHTPDVLMYDEILLRILHFAMLFDKPHPPENCADQDTGLSCGRCLGFIRASHVCHRWRKIALATPSLWIRDAFVLFHTDAMRTIFGRAQDLPLDLDVNVRDEMDITELPLRRARKLNILRTSRNTWNRQAMLVKMAMHVCSSYDNDMLEDVSISFPPVVFNRTLTAQTQFPTLFAPLRALRTENICFPWSSPSLTYLSVHGFANPRLTPSAGLFLSCLSASPKLEVISISSFLPSLGMTEKTGPYTIMLPKLKILQIHDLAELSLMLLSRFILPADVYIEVDMESTKETPLLAHFDAAIQPHVQNFLSLDYFCSLAVITDPVLSISVLPIGFEKSRTSHGRSRRGGLQGKDWKWFADADEWPGPGVIIRSTIAGSGTVSFLDYMAFASYLLFPHTPRVLSLDITPNVDMMPAQWMDSLDPFTAVDTISFPAPGRTLLSRNLLRALELRPTRILPNLTSLMVKFEAPPAEFEGLDDTRVAKNELEELIELITGVVVSRLQTGRDAVIGSIHLTGRNDDADSLMKLADRLSVYVPETDAVSVEEHSI